VTGFRLSQVKNGTSAASLKVTLLGAGGPKPRLERFGPSILMEAGTERFLVDCGRGAAQRLFQLGRLTDVSAVFLTHLHSDHIVGLPDLWLTGWFSRAGDSAARVGTFGNAGDDLTPRDGLSV